MADAQKPNKCATMQNKNFFMNELRQKFESKAENPAPSHPPQPKPRKAKPRPVPKPRTKTTTLQDVPKQDSFSGGTSAASEIVCKEETVDSSLNKEYEPSRNVADEEGTKNLGQLYEAQSHTPSVQHTDRNCNIYPKSYSSHSATDHQAAQQVKEDRQQVPIDDEKVHKDIYSDQNYEQSRSNVKQMSRQFERKSPTSAADADNAEKSVDNIPKPVPRKRKMNTSFMRRMEATLCSQIGGNISGSNTSSDASNQTNQQNVEQGQTSDDLGTTRESIQGTPDIITQQCDRLEYSPNSKGKM